MKAMTQDVYGSADVLVRPFSSDDLLARIRACVSSSPAS